jgi:hypothetical protein
MSKVTFTSIGVVAVDPAVGCMVTVRVPFIRVAVRLVTVKVPTPVRSEFQQVLPVQPEFPGPISETVACPAVGSVTP